MTFSSVSQRLASTIHYEDSSYHQKSTCGDSPIATKSSHLNGLLTDVVVYHPFTPSTERTRTATICSFTGVSFSNIFDPYCHRPLLEDSTVGKASQCQPGASLKINCNPATAPRGQPTKCRCYTIIMNVIKKNAPFLFSTAKPTALSF